MRRLIDMVETVDPGWVEQVFNLPEYSRLNLDIDGVELNIAALGVELNDHDVIGIRGIETPEAMRGQGRGMAVLRALVAGSERYGRPLELAAYPYERRGEDRKWRASTRLRLFGFRPAYGPDVHLKTAGSPDEVRLR